MGQYKVSNWNAKKAFSEFILKNRIIPPIYIDEYWDYYINEYNLTDYWNEFLKEFQEDKLDFKTFIDEFYKIINTSIKFFSQHREEFNDRCEKILSELNTNDQMPQFETYNIPDGDYLVVDMHNAFDETLKLIDPNHINTYEFIDSNTKYKSLKNKKGIRLKLFDYTFPPNEMNRLYQITNNILLEKIYKSEDPELKKITEHLNFVGKTYGDSYMYKINDSISPDVFKDYDCDGLKYHIEKWEVRTITIFNIHCKCIIIKDKDDRIITTLLYSNKIKLNIANYPFAFKLTTGEELNEKDLTVGWDDQIFFHFDKSEII